MAGPRGTGSSKDIAKAACLSDRLEHLRSPQAGVSFWHNCVIQVAWPSDGIPIQRRHSRQSHVRETYPQPRSGCVFLKLRKAWILVHQSAKPSTSNTTSLSGVSET